jgi:hypothetical protein
MKRLAVLLLAGCGYHAVAGGAPPSDRFAVVLSHTNVPDAVASDEVLAGVREELARAGALKTGDGYPRCEIEVLRADETSDGIAAVRDPAHGGGLQPVARGTRVGLVARAWIVRERDGVHERDTGDVRALDEVATASDARASSFQYTDAMRAAGRRVGHSLGAHIVGLPSTSE